MRRHAKAPTAGPTKRQATGLGRFFRGAFATRGATSRAKGSGAPKAKARVLVLPAAVLALVLALAVGSASGSTTRFLVEVFGSSAEPSFSADKGLAYDQGAEQLYAIDSTEDVLYRFNADGSAANFGALGSNEIDGEGGAGEDETAHGHLAFSSNDEREQVALDESGEATDGNVYVTQSAEDVVDIFNGEGEYLGQLSESTEGGEFGEPCGVAVDGEGTVYVGDRGDDLIHVFDPAAAVPVNGDSAAESIDTLSNPCSLAAGAGATAGFLFVNQSSGSAHKVDAATGEVKYEIASSANTLTVDPSTGHVFLARNCCSGSTVEEYDASEAAEATLVSSFKPGSTTEGVAANSAEEQVYVARSSTENVEVFGPAAIVPDPTTTAATAITATTATVNGTVNPDGVELSECFFEYGKTTAYGETVPCAESTGSIGSGTSPVAVHADIGGLEPGGIVYHFRLVAKNPGAPVINGSDQSFATDGPELLDSWSEDVLITEARFRAEINPKGVATTFRVEYGETAAYGKESGELSVGSDSSAHKVGFAAEDLAPGTEYHWRVVATSEVAENVGPDHTIRTFRPFAADTDCPNQANRHGEGAALPDCRAYEMVSPVEKNNGDVRPLASSEASWPAQRTKATPAGDKLTYSSATSFADALSAPYTSQYIAQRLPGGWETHAINPPQTNGVVTGINGQYAQYEAFSEDLCMGWMKSTHEPTLAPSGMPGVRNIYRYNDRLCGPQGFEAIAPVVGETFESFSVSSLYVLGASADGSHAIFTSLHKLAAEGTAGQRQLYESTEPEAPPRLVCILPNGEPHTNGCTAGTGSDHPSSSITTRRISEDGSRIFWGDRPSTSGIAESKIYVRIDGTETVPVSQAGEEEVGATVSRFVNASSDGSRAIYSADPAGPVGRTLFAFDVDSEATERIADEIEGVLGMSEDARRVYFLSREVLPGGGANSEGDEAIEGRPNLYLYDADGEGAGFSFIGTLTEDDTGLSGGGTPVHREARRHLSSVTPAGRYVAFVSAASLTGYDNERLAFSGVNPLAYVYDAQRGELICASCIPSGARGYREVREANTAIQGQLLLRTFDSHHLPLHPLVPGRLFFNTANALTPRDGNGRVDVYQWEQAGVGGCDAADSTYAPSARGCISLISSGKSAAESEFATASASGDDVFFYTTSNLVPEDFARRDIYDAKAGGGFPLPPEAPECVGDACQSIPSAPEDPTPASAGFRGAGDPAPRPNCGARARRAVKFSRRAKRLRKAAKRSSAPKRSKRLRRKSTSFAKQAKRLSRSATRCRRANRRAAR